MDGSSRLRRLVLIVLALGMSGTLVDLLLLSHYEDTSQLIPIALLVPALVIAGVHAVRPTLTSVRTLRALMTLFVAAGLIGIGLHYRGAAAFQLEIDPSQHWWDVAKKVARAQSPPLLAPGAMLQLGLIGLVYTFRHPVAGGSRAFEEVNT